MDINSVIAQFWKPAVFSFVLALFLVVLATKVFPKINLLDRPEKYGISRKPIPYYGGIVIYLAFFVSSIVFLPMSKLLIGLLVAGSLIALLGFFDDLLDLSPWIRLAFQFLATLILVLFGIGILSFSLPFFGVLDLTGVSFEVFNVEIIFWSAIFTIFWVMAIVNVMNFLDGVSGLNSGVSFIAALTIFFLSIHPGVHDAPETQVVVATLALILAMVSLAFMIFDFPKPKILMGDTGSTFLGFLLASLAIFSGGKVATAFLVLGIPILDMIWVVLRRTLEGKKFWQGDLKHLHHRLLDLGFSKRKVVLSYYGITAFLGLLAVSLVSGQQKFFMLIALLVLMSILAAALIFIPKKK